jgi:hypothetical protein
VKDYTVPNNTYKIYTPPQPVGAWVIDPPDNETGAGHCTWFCVFRKPTEQQIKNTEETFGWKWRNM